MYLCILDTHATPHALALPQWKGAMVRARIVCAYTHTRIPWNMSTKSHNAIIQWNHWNACIAAQARALGVRGGAESKRVLQSKGQKPKPNPLGSLLMRGGARTLWGFYCYPLPVLDLCKKSGVFIVENKNRFKT